MKKQNANQLLVRKNSKNKYGQYFTPEIVATFMIELAEVALDAQILEPSSGKGVFLELLQAKGYTNITGYELDETLISEKLRRLVKNQSFVSTPIKEKFDLIIGNPPYIRWKNLEQELKEELSSHYLWNKHFNSLCDYSYIFILKSIELLKEGGQLIFITPEYWLNTTHSKNLRNYMVKQGFFEKIYHFNETPIFEGATVSTIIFKYVKSKIKKKFIDLTKYYSSKKLTKEILSDIKQNKKNNFFDYIKISQFKQNKTWLLASENTKLEMTNFESKCKINGITSSDLFSTEIRYTTIGDICDIGNGMVSGLDKAFQLNGEVLTKKEKAFSLDVVKAKDLKSFYYKNITKYIYVNEIEQEATIKQDFPNYYHKLQPYKEKLEKRYLYNRDIPYWKWVFLRNFKLFSSSKDRILVPCKERISNKDYFRFAYAESNIFPTQDVTAIFKKDDTKESLYYILALLNDSKVFQWLIYNGIVKGNIVEFSERPIASIPFRRIDWNNQNEVILHDKISNLTQEYIKSRETKTLVALKILIEKLFD